ncbi:MAG: putative glycolipid-binding domain-containing protein [Gemmatimonadota bacterium]
MDVDLIRSVLWYGRELPLMEFCRLSRVPDGFRLEGSVVGSIEETPLVVLYEVSCDAAWCTRAVRVQMLSERGDQELELAVDADRRWWRDGAEMPKLEGLVDVDLGVTPSTNTLPLRRLALRVGEAADVEAAWVKFPELHISVLPQRYERRSAREYAYSSRSGEFRAVLDVDEDGLVATYGSYWTRID